MTDRFRVRASHSEIGPTLWRVWDARERRWLGAFTREALAVSYAARLELQHIAGLFGGEEVA